MATFPMCAFSAPWQKYTTLLYSPGFDQWLSPLGRLDCPHDSHERVAGGVKDDEVKWSSAEASAYPPGFNYYLARAIAALRLGSSPVIRTHPRYR